MRKEEAEKKSKGKGTSHLFAPWARARILANVGGRGAVLLTRLPLMLLARLASMRVAMHEAIPANMIHNN